MMKVAVFVLADKETHGDLGRVSNALMCAKEFKEAGDDVKLIFDGAGTQWITELSKVDHKLYGLFNSVNKIAGACSFCASAFGVKEGVRACSIPLLEEFNGHPSIRKLVSQGYQIITF